MIKLMALASILTKMELDMKVSGKTINSMERVWKLGLTKPLTKECTLKAKSTDLVSLLGQMVAPTKALLLTTTLRVMAATDGQTAVFTRAAGRTTKCTEVAFSFGPTVELTKVPTLTIRKKVTALSPGQTNANTLALG